eukprot:m.479085 g.479085  ORF g.479085 m.479085 type:complete len:202 (+) comp48291_c0_seq1:270-875(+)
MKGCSTWDLHPDEVTFVEGVKSVFANYRSGGIKHDAAKSAVDLADFILTLNKAETEVRGDPAPFEAHFARRAPMRPSNLPHLGQKELTVGSVVDRLSGPPPMSAVARNELKTVQQNDCFAWWAAVGIVTWTVVMCIVFFVLALDRFYYLDTTTAIQLFGLAAGLGSVSSAAAAYVFSQKQLRLVKFLGDHEALLQADAAQP